jgi:hypothetical protein
MLYPAELRAHKSTNPDLEPTESVLDWLKWCALRDSNSRPSGS